MGYATRSIGRQEEAGVPQGIRGDKQNVCTGSGVPQAAWGDRQNVMVCYEKSGE
jgi:hypothetical protein